MSQFEINETTTRRSKIYKAFAYSLNFFISNKVNHLKKKQKFEIFFSENFGWYEIHRNSLVSELRKSWFFAIQLDRKNKSLSIIFNELMWIILLKKKKNIIVQNNKSKFKKKKLRIFINFFFNKNIKFTIFIKFFFIKNHFIK